MFQITGDIGAPLCASLDVLLRLLETLPLFPANLAYQSQSPIICRFTPKAYAQPWLGLHSLNLPHTPSFDSHRKAEDVLKEAIIRSTGGGVAATARTDPSASTSTAPTQISRDAKTLPLGGLPSSSSSAVCSPSKRRCTKSPSPQRSQSGSSSSGESSASERRIKRESFELIEFIRIGFQGSGSGSESQGRSPARSEASAGARSVHLGAASVGSVEVLSGDEASGGEDDVWTLPMRQMCPKAVCPCLTSPPQMMRIPANAKHASLPIKVTPTSRHGKTNSSVKG